MKKNNKRIIITKICSILVITMLSAKVFCYPHATVKNNIAVTKLIQSADTEDSERIVIGYKLVDSAAIITIKNYAIQQLIIRNIPLLQNMLMTAEPATLLDLKNKPFLSFTVLDSVNKKLCIAIELKKKDNGLYIFNYTRGREIFIGYANGSCNSCSFVIEKDKITGVKCNGQYFTPGGSTPAATTAFVSKTIE